MLTWSDSLEYRPQLGRDDARATAPTSATRPCTLRAGSDEPLRRLAVSHRQVVEVAAGQQVSSQSAALAETSQADRADFANRQDTALVNGDVVHFDQLANADLDVDRIYRGGTFGGTRDDPLCNRMRGCCWGAPTRGLRSMQRGESASRPCRPPLVADRTRQRHFRVFPGKSSTSGIPGC